MIDLKNNHRRAVKKIESTIAFNSPDFDISHVIARAEEDILTKQIQDYRNGD